MNKKKDMITVEELELIFSNPFYCITIEPTMCMEHPPMVTEEEWIQAGVNLIKEIGAEKYLTRLLQNLKGDYVTGESN